MPQNRTCKNCHKEIPPEAKFCPHCGTPVAEENWVICKNCGEKNSPEARFCKNCGTALPRGKKEDKEEISPAETLTTAQRPFWQNPYFVILVVALIAMVVVTVYNFRYLRIEQKKMQSSSMSSAANMPSQAVAPADNPPQQLSPEQVEQHIQELKKQLKERPNDVQLYIQLGNLLFDTQRFKDAIPYYEKAVQLDPTNPDVIVDLGVSYFELENYPKAKQLFQTALKINPNHTHALYNLGVVSLQLQDFPTLMDAWGKLMQIAPNSPQAQQASHILDEIHKAAQQKQKGG